MDSKIVVHGLVSLHGYAAIRQTLDPSLQGLPGLQRRQQTLGNLGGARGHMGGKGWRKGGISLVDVLGNMAGERKWGSRGQTTYAVPTIKAHKTFIVLL